jgi:hypothetical protein
MNTSTLRWRHTWHSHPEAMNIALWSLQILLAAVFGMAGAVKCFEPLPQLALSIPWVPSVPAPLIRFIGAAELFGAVGLLGPMLSGIMPFLTRWAGVGLAVDMLFATAFHLMRGELAMLPVTLTLGLLAAVVALGRMDTDERHPRR